MPSVILRSKSLTNLGVRLFKLAVVTAEATASGSVQEIVAVKEPFPEAVIF